MWFSRLRTFFLVTLGLVFFRNAAVPDALRMIGRGFSAFNPQVLINGTLFSLGLDWIEFTIAVFSLLILGVVSLLQQKEGVRQRLERRGILFRWAVLYALLFYVILLGQYGPGYSASEFIYQNFRV